MNSRILFFAPFGEWSVHNQVDAVMATALRVRGADVRVVRCDGIYPACDVLAWAGAETNARCAACAKTGQDFFGRFDLPISQLREHLTPEDFARADAWAAAIQPTDYATAEWEGLPLGQWVTSSIFSYFRITVRSLARPEVQAMHRRFLVTGVLTWKALSRVMDEFQPTHSCLCNGRMAAFRVALELSKRRGLRAFTHERGWISDTFIFYENEDCLSTQPVKQCAETWKDIPLTQEQCLAAQSYLAAREQGQGMNYPSFYSYQTASAAVRRALRISEQARVLLVLTSSEYEMASSEHFQSLPNQLDIIDRLIEVFRNRREFLVVRHHPYIAGDQLVPPDCDFLTRAYRQASAAPPNIRIIMPSEALNSYALLWNIDACIAFVSTTGLEAAARGVPVAAFPESVYQQALPQVITQTSAEGLQELVDDLYQRRESYGVPDLRRVYRFLYSFIHRLPKRFRSFGIKDHFAADLRYARLDDLRPGADAELDRVCDCVLHGTPLASDPTEHDRAQDAKAETEFLHQQGAEIKRQQARTQEKTRWHILWKLNPPVAVVRLEYPGSLARSAFFPLGSFRTRHTHIHHYPCVLENPVRHPDSLQGILGVLADVQEDYVLVTEDSVLHDEAFLSSAVDQLLDDADCQLDGILFGAWLAPRGQDITGEVFTQRVPAEDYTRALRRLPALIKPQNLLPFGLFRCEKLVPLLEAAVRVKDPEAAARQLFAALQTPAFRQTRLPMLVLSRLEPATSNQEQC